MAFSIDAKTPDGGNLHIGDETPIGCATRAYSSTSNFVTLLREKREARQEEYEFLVETGSPRTEATMAKARKNVNDDISETVNVRKQIVQ